LTINVSIYISISHSYKTTIKQRQKIILQGKKLPSHSKIVHTNRTLKDSIKKEQIFHYLYGFI
ncbi:hypothetical protein DW917_14635, partial [Prevotella sp. AM42-24]